MSENLKQITTNFLFDRKYDGLCNPETHCACIIDKLMPCGAPQEICTPGYKFDIDNGQFKITSDQD